MMDYFSRPYLLPDKRLEKIVFFFIFLITGLGVFFSHWDPMFFEQSWVGKHGWVEYLVMLALLLCVLINIYRANILSPFRSNLFIVCTWLIALLFFFCFGEKISWGQYLFDFRPIDFFIHYNTRGETNLYHLKFGDWRMGTALFDQLLKILFIVHVIVFPILYNQLNVVRKLVDHLALPLPRLYHTLGYVTVVLLCEGIAGGRKEEIVEFAWSWFLLLMLCRPYNRILFSRVSLER